MPWVASRHVCTLPDKAACDKAGAGVGSVWKCDTTSCDLHWQVQSINTTTGGPVYTSVRAAGQGWANGMPDGQVVTREAAGNQTAEQAKVLNLGLKL